MDLILKKRLYRGTGELVWTLKISKIPIRGKRKKLGRNGYWVSHSGK